MAPICTRCAQEFYYDFGDPNIHSRICLDCYYERALVKELVLADLLPSEKTVSDINELLEYLDEA